MLCRPDALCVKSEASSKEKVQLDFSRLSAFTFLLMWQDRLIAVPLYDPSFQPLNLGHFLEVVMEHTLIVLCMVPTLLIRPF
jgi:hypothetical protein